MLPLENNSPHPVNVTTRNQSNQKNQVNHSTASNTVIKLIRKIK